MKTESRILRSSPLFTLITCLALAFFAFSGVSSVHAQSAESEADSSGKTIIILDASGSMWGKVKGGVKIDIAKKAISDLLPTIDSNMEIGLVAYGHRRKGDCKDIELLVPPAKNNHAAILRAVQNIAPRGKTPLCDAVMFSAKILRFEEAKSTVILISDGIETCGKDPCAIGDQLAAKGINFVCHVIAFDITKEKNANLDCLSTKTGGLYVEAKDAKSLKDALGRVMKTVVKKKTTLILSGKNATGKMLSGVNFEIYQGKTTESPLLRGRGGKYRTELKPGDYTIIGTFGKLRAQTTLTIPEGKTTQHTLTFKATGLTVQSSLTEGGPMLQQHVSWKVFLKKDTPDAKPIAYSYDAKPTFNLAPGTYIVRAQYKQSKTQKEVTITADKSSSATLVFGAGTIVAQARMSEKSAPLTKHLSWNLYYAEPDAEGDLRRVTYSYDPKTHLVVPSGKYILKVKYKNSSAQKEVEVKAGEITELMLTLGAGTLTVEFTLTEGGKPIQRGIYTELYSPENEEGDRKRVNYSYNPKAIFKVPSGHYLLKIRTEKRALNLEKEVVVTSGETNKLTINLNAGIWKGAVYMSAQSAEPATKNIRWTFWTLPNEEGASKRVAESYSSKPPRILFPAGTTFIAKVTRGKASAQKKFTVSAGKITQDKLILNAGILDLSTVSNSEGNTKFYAKIYNAKQDPEQKTQRPILYFTNRKRRYYLPAGDYIIVPSLRKKGDEKPAEIKITIEAGKLHKVELK